MPPPMPPNVQQTPDGTSYDTARDDPAAQAACSKIEIIPQPGGAGPGGGFLVNCFRDNAAQPETVNAQSPQELLQIVGQALGLTPPAPAPSDATAESASMPA